MPSQQMTLVAVVIADGLSRMAGVRGIGGVAMMRTHLPTAETMAGGTMAGGERVCVAGWYFLNILVSQF